MKKSNNWMWIVGIVLLLIFITNSGLFKKEASSLPTEIPNVGQKFGVYISSYPNEVEAFKYFTFNVRVNDLTGKGGTMYVECGMHDASSSWLPTMATISPQGQYYSCGGAIEYYTDVRKVTLSPNEDATVQFGFTSQQDTTKNYVLLCDTFLYCGEGLGNTPEYSIKNIYLKTSNGNGETPITGDCQDKTLFGNCRNTLLEEDLKDSLRFPSLQTIKDSTCDNVRQCESVEDYDIFCTDKDKFEDTYNIDVDTWWKIDRTGICIARKSGGFCISSVSSLIEKIGINMSCQTNTIIFFVGIFMIFMLMMSMMKK